MPAGQVRAISRFALILRAHWLMIVAVTMTFVIAAALYDRTSKPTYVTSAQIQLGTLIETVPLLGLYVLYPDVGPGLEAARMSRIINSAEVQSAALKDLRRKGFSGPASGGLGLAPVPGRVSVIAADSNPRRAAAVANALAQATVQAERRDFADRLAKFSESLRARAAARRRSCSRKTSSVASSSTIETWSPPPALTSLSAWRSPLGSFRRPCRRAPRFEHPEASVLQ